MYNVYTMVGSVVSLITLFTSQLRRDFFEGQLSQRFIRLVGIAV